MTAVRLVSKAGDSPDRQKQINLVNTFGELANVIDAGLMADFSKQSRPEQVYTMAQLQLSTARYSQTVSQVSGGIETIPELMGFDNAYPFESRGVQGMVLTVDGTAYVTFCGTNDFADIARHAGVLEKTNAYAGESVDWEKIKVQSEYARVAIGEDTPLDKNVSNTVQDILEGLHDSGEVDSFHMVGFSDGGNIATLVALDIQLDANRGSFPMEVGSVTAFDSPPAGNKHFAKLFDEIIGEEKYNYVGADLNAVNATYRVMDGLGGYTYPEQGLIAYTDGVHKHSLLEMIESMRPGVGDRRDERVQEYIETGYRDAYLEQKNTNSNESQTFVDAHDSLRGRLDVGALSQVASALVSCGVTTDRSDYTPNGQLETQCSNYTQTAELGADEVARL